MLDYPETIIPRLRTLPRTADEWTALVKVGSGDLDISARLRDRLAALGLVFIAAGIPALTPRGRLTLGLPD